MRLLVGCPVAHREWILPRWFEHVFKAAETAGVDVGFVFVCDERDESLPVIRSWAPDALVVPCTTRRGRDERLWNQKRYQEMVLLRNSMLRAVRHAKPNAFLSLDSDILLHPDQIGLLLEGLERFDAVGGRCYMTPPSMCRVASRRLAAGRKFPSYANLTRAGGLTRPDSDQVLTVQVIMAIKLMGPTAYRIDYEPHVQGEDIGWSLAAREAGLKLGWDGRVVAKHVLGPQWLDPVDDRVGF